MARPTWEVSDVLSIGYPKLSESDQLPYVVQKAAQDIMQCRTRALGGHISACSHCSHQVISYNSCRNRHCPKCQYSKREQWILDREADVLPVRYFHVVFTLPHELNAMTMAFPKIMYGLIFKAAWKTIQTLGNDRKWLGAKMGMISLLHTWGQNLSYHPHLHCIIPGGGYIPELKRWVFLKHRKFLFPVRVISALFRRFYIELLSRAILAKTINWDICEWNILKSKIYKSSFNVYSKTPFAGPEQVIQYLGRYSHRVAITNHRITHLSETQVSFTYKDYRDNQKKLMTLTTIEFSRRFLQHVLPSGFAKIRHYGFLANKVKNKYISEILLFLERRKKPKQTFSAIHHFQRQFGIDLNACPKCKNGKLIRMAELPDARGDPYANQIMPHPKTFANLF